MVGGGYQLSGVGCPEYTNYSEILYARYMKKMCIPCVPVLFDRLPGIIIKFIGNIHGHPGENYPETRIE